jgi:hypothetical protein
MADEQLHRGENAVAATKRRRDCGTGRDTDAGVLIAASMRTRHTRDDG